MKNASIANTPPPTPHECPIVKLEWHEPQEAAKALNSIMYQIAVAAVEKRGETDTARRLDELFLLHNIAEGLSS